MTRAMPFDLDKENSIQRLMLGKNSLDVSSFKTLSHHLTSKGFAIKYVVEGLETYVINGETLAVSAGKYLLTNDAYAGHALIDSPKNVKGICINIDNQLLAEVAATRHRPDTAFVDFHLGDFLTQKNYLENQYDAQKTELGYLLKQLSITLVNQNFECSDLNQEFFYTFAEKLVLDQIPVFKQLQSIPSVKAETRRDLLKRISRGKEFIDAYFLTPLTVQIIAREAHISEYHFFRLFKCIYGVSPLQYIIKKRLEFGQKILQSDHYSVSAAAHEAGFSDIHAFSKAFKKHFGYSPSAIISGK